MHIFIKRTARQLSSFLSLKKVLPTPTGFCGILVTHVMLLLRNGVLGSTGPVH
jgi:hypothetical protein